MPDKKAVNDLVSKLRKAVDAQSKVMSAAKQTAQELEAEAERVYPAVSKG